MPQEQELLDLTEFIKSARASGLAEDKIDLYLSRHKEEFRWEEPKQQPSKPQVSISPSSLKGSAAMGDIRGLARLAEEQKKAEEIERFTRSVKTSKEISSFRDEIEMIGDGATKYEVHKFLEATTGASLNDLGDAAKTYLGELGSTGPIVTKAPKEYSASDYYVRGLTPPVGVKTLGMGALQLGFTAFAPEATIVYLASGAISNLGHKFQGYAIPIPRKEAALFKSERDMDINESRAYQAWLSAHPQEFYLAGNEKEAAQIMARLGRGYKQEDLVKLPPMDFSKIPKISWNDLGREDSLVPVGTNRILKYYTPKSVGEVVGETAKTVASLGLDAPTPGEAFAIQTGTENTPLAAMYDILAFAGIAEFHGIKGTARTPGTTPPLPHEIVEKASRIAWAKAKIVKPEGLPEKTKTEIAKDFRIGETRKPEVKSEGAGRAPAGRKVEFSANRGGFNKGDILEFNNSQRTARVSRVSKDGFIEEYEYIFRPGETPESVGVPPTVKLQGIEVVRGEVPEVKTRPTIEELITTSLAKKLPKNAAEFEAFPAEVKAIAGDKTPPERFSEQLANNVKAAAMEGELVDPNKLDTGIGPIGYYAGTPASRLGASTMKGPQVVQDFFFNLVYRDYEIDKLNTAFRERVYEKVPKGHRDQIPEIMMGRTIEQIAKDYPKIGKEGMDALRSARDSFEADRLFIAKEEGLDPATFGHKDRYFPGVFRGQLEITRTDGVRMGFAQTRKEAKAIISESAKRDGRPESDYDWKYKAPNANSWLRLANEERKKIVDTLAEAADIAPSDVAHAFDDLGLTKKGGQFFLKQKKFAPNFEKRPLVAMDVYNRAMANYKFLRPIKSAVEAQITRWRNAGLEYNADMLQSSWDAAVAQPTTFSKWLDKKLFNVFGGRVAPRALERWSGRFKQGQGLYYVANPKFGLITNPSQPIETLAPYGKIGDFLEAKFWLYTKEGKEAIARFGHEKAGSKFFSSSEAATTKFVRGFSNIVFASEPANQHWAWAYFYKRGLSLGLSPEQANKMGVLRGMIGTQYFNLAADRPWFARGPIGSTVYQFTRFKTKNIEQLFDMLRYKEFNAATKYVAAKFLLGGAGAYIGTEAYLELRKEHPRLADFVYFGGLGTLLGSDFTSTFNIGIDMGPGHLSDKISRQILGVPGNSILSIAKEMASPSRGIEATSALGRGWRAIIRKSPLGKDLLALNDMFDENNRAYRTADGRGGILRDGTMTFKSLLGLADTRITIARGLAEKSMRIWDERNEYRTKSYQHAASDLTNPNPDDFTYEDLRQKTIDQWNEMNPDFPIDEGKPWRIGFAEFLIKNDPGNTLFDVYMSRFGKRERAFLLDEIEEHQLSEEAGK